MTNTKSRTVISIAVHLIIAVLMIGVYKWLGQSVAYNIAMAWTIYTSIRALIVVLLGSNACRKLGIVSEDPEGLMFITISVGIIPFIILGWYSTMAFGCVCLAFEGFIVYATRNRLETSNG